MPIYWMTVTLEMTDEVEADTPEEAFVILSNDANKRPTRNVY